MKFIFNVLFWIFESFFLILEAIWKKIFGSLPRFLERAGDQRTIEIAVIKEDIQNALVGTFDHLIAASKDPELLTRSFEMSSRLAACAGAFREVHSVKTEDYSIAMNFLKAQEAGDLITIELIDIEIAYGLQQTLNPSVEEKRNFTMSLLAPDLVFGNYLTSTDFKKGWVASKSGDFMTALKKWKLLSEQGYSVAQYELGSMHYNGKGSEKDHVEALKWYRLAAKKGHPDAQYALAQMYYKGEGVIQDYVLCRMWFSISGARGYKKGTKMRVLVEEEMTPDQIAESTQRAKLCMGSNYQDCDWVR
jgi:hypothetical protein